MYVQNLSGKKKTLKRERAHECAIKCTVLVLSRKGKEGRKKNIFGPPEIDLVIKKKGKMLSLVICLLHFFFFPNALLGAAV